MEDTTFLRSFNETERRAPSSVGPQGLRVEARTDVQGGHILTETEKTFIIGVCEEDLKKNT